MSDTKIRVQDIADALHLSRVTVSKALNHHPSVPENTTRRVFEKAIEMNYKFLGDSRFSGLIDEQKNSPGQIAVLFSKDIDRQHVGFSILSRLSDILGEKNYSVSLYFISKKNLESGQLPDAFAADQISAILCVEIFHEQYTRMLCSLGKPVIFLDAYPSFLTDQIPADVLLTESRYSFSRIIRKIIQDHGLERIGFVGPYLHCLSFLERWQGYQIALAQENIPYAPQYCILSNDDDLYWHSELIASRLRMMNPLPQLFVCANDALAIHLMSSLQEMKYRVPEDVRVLGFDNSPAAALSHPRLTTVDANSHAIGTLAARILLERIAFPGQPNTAFFVQSRFIPGQSA
jgi:LacI family transcriptional regulator